MQASGAVVADGAYNVQFNLYSASTGGSSLWTETYLNSASQGIVTKNGYITTSLGSLNAFPNNIPWDQELWVGMTIRGTGSCAFGSCTPLDDEMTPRMKVTAVPYAFRAAEATQLKTINGANVSTLSLNTTTSNQVFQIQDQGVAGTYNLCVQNSASCGFALLSGANTFTGVNTFNAAGTALSVTNNASVGGTLTVGSVAGTGLFTNNGATLNTTLVLTNFNYSGTGNTGSIGLATDTVDKYTNIAINQNATAGQTLTIPNPTTATAGRVIYITNIGSVGYTMAGAIVSPGVTMQFIWSGSAWSLVTSGVSGSYIQNGTSLQTANFNIQSNAVGSVTATIQGANSQTANILEVKAAGVGSPLFSVGATGATVFQNSANSTTAFQVKDQAGTGVALSVDTTNLRVGIGTTAPSELLQVGVDNEIASARKALRFGTGGFAAPGAFSTNSNGDKLIFYNGVDFDGRFGASAGGEIWLKALSTNTSNAGFGSLSFYTGQGTAVTPKLRVHIGATGDLALGGTITSATNYTGASLVVSGGNIGIGTITPGAQLQVNTTTAATIGQIIKAAGSQTADLYQLQDSAGNINASFNATGNQLTLGRVAASGTVTQGKLLLADGTTDNFAGTLQTTTLTANRTYTLPDVGGTICTTTTCAIGSGGTALVQVPTSNTAGTAGANVIQPTAASINGLTINATNNGATGATALIVNQGNVNGGTFDGANINVTNTTGTIGNGLLISKSGAGTITSLLNLTQSAGTATNGIIFNGTITNDITSAAARGLTVVTGTTGALTLDTGTTGQINLGTGVGGSKTIQIGTTAVNTGNTQTINIGNTAAAGTTNVTIGAATGATGGTTTLQSVGTLTLGNAISSGINIQAIAGGTIGIGNSANNILNLNTGAVAGSTTIGGTSTTGTITLGQSTDTNTVNIATGATASGKTQTINIGTGGVAGSTTTTTIGSTIAGNITLQSAGTINVNAPTIVGNAATQALFNTTATTVNAFGAATSINMGAITAGGTSVFNTPNITLGNTTNRGTVTNNGGSFYSTLVVSNDADGGVLGAGLTAAQSVDIYSSIAINQTTAGQTITIPSPTTTTIGRLLFVTNTGSTTFVINGTTFNTGATATMFWNGSGWAFAGMDGGSNNYVQLAPGTVQTDATNNASIFINKTSGTGNLIQLQKGGADVFSVSNTGATLFKNTSNTTTAFQIQPNGSTTPVFNVDTTNLRVGIGTNAPTTELEVVGDITSTGTKWTARTGAADNDWRSVAYGNGLYVAVSVTGSSNRVMTSPDGVNWTARTTGGNSWQSVAYGNGMFVAVSSTGTGNRVMTSPDGITWTTASGIVDNQWTGIAYGNGMFVATAVSGTANRAMVSRDGVNWTIGNTTGFDNSWYSVTYGNGIFVAVSYTGSTNRVMTSTDGITWATKDTTGKDLGWRAVTYGNGLFVAVANNGTGNRVMTSPDGTTWTLRTSAADNSWYSVTYGGGLFVATSITGTGNRVMTSPDGVNWTIRTSPVDTDWYGVTYGNGMFVGVGYNAAAGNRAMTSGKQDLISVSNNNTYQGGIKVYGSSQFISDANSTTAFRIQNSSGTSLFTVDTTNTAIAVDATMKLNGNTLIGDASSDRLTVTSQILGGSPLVFQGATDDAFTTTLAVTDPTANNTITLPNESGTICTTGSVCTGYAPSATNGYVQLAPASAQADATTNSSIFINKTNTGNLLQLQQGAADKFVVDNNGNLTAAGTYNGNTFTSSVLSFGAASTATVKSASGKPLVLQGGGAAGGITVSNSGIVGIGGGTGEAMLTLQNGISGIRFNRLGNMVQINSASVSDSSTAASSTAAAASFVGIGQGIAYAANTNVTVTNAANLYIAGAYKAGTNVAMTNSYGLRIDTASVAGGNGVTNAYGLSVQAPTGATNNYAAIFQGGNVGIGTTSPGAKLDVSGGDIRNQTGNLLLSSGSANISFHNTDTTPGNRYFNGLVYSNAGGVLALDNSAGSVNIRVSNDTNYPFRIYSNSWNGSSYDLTERLRVDGSNGNVGIGTASPVSKLAVSGADGAWSSTFKGNLNIAGSADNSLSVGSYSTGPYGVWLQAGDNRIGSATTYPLLLQPIGGDVGIGTTSPGAKLHVYNADTANVITSDLKVEHTGGGGGAGTAIDLMVGGGVIGRISGVNDGSSSGSMRFSTAQVSTGTVTERMRIDNIGNVGIGTVSPSQRLEVQGNVQIGNANVTSAGLLMTRLNGGTTGTMHTAIQSANSPAYQTVFGGSWSSEGAGTTLTSGALYQSAAPAAGQMRFGYINTAGAFNSSNMVDILYLSSTAGGSVSIGTSTVGNNNKLIVNPYSTVDNLATAQINTNAATNKGLVVQGFASQSADYLQLQDSTGSVLTNFDSYGHLVIGSNSAATPLVALNNSAAGIEILGSGDNVMNIYADGGMIFRIDYNDNFANNTYDFLNGSNNRIAALDENGVFQLGNDIATPQAGSILFNDSVGSNGFNLSLGSAALTANRTITLPNETGTICTTGSVCTGYAPSATNGYVQFAPASAQTDATNNSSIFINKTSGTGNILQLQKSGVDKLVVDNSGNVGIGTATPSNTLEVNKAVGTVSATQLTVANSNAGGYGAGISFTGKQTDDGLMYEQAKITADGEGNWANTAARSSGLRFFTVNAGTLSEKLRVTASGAVGIGTTNPGTNQLVVDNGTSTNAIFVARDNGTPVFTIADGGAITATQSITAVGVNAGAGLLQGSLGLTVTGAVASINNNSNFATNINTGTSTGAVSIGNSAAGAITLQSGGAINMTAGAASTWSTGANTLTVTSSNFNVSSLGVVTVAGAQTRDITTAGAATSNALAIGPGTSTAATGTGAALNLRGGDQSGTTTSTGGAISILGGNATGASGTRNGGAVTIDAGTGANANGAITIGGTNAASIALGRSGITTTITGGLTQSTGAVSLTGNAASSFTTSAGALTLTSAAAATWSTGAGTLTLQGFGGTTINTPAIATAATNSSPISITTGNASGTGASNSGAITVDTGTSTNGTTGSISLGTANASSVLIGRSSAATSPTLTLQGGATSSFSAVNATGTTKLAFAAPSTAGVSTFQLPAGGTGGNTYDICTTFSVCTGYAATPASGSYIKQVPTSTAENTITPTAASVVGLTVNGTSGTAATALAVSQPGAAAGITVTSANNTATNGLSFSGTFTNLINATNFSVTNAGAVTAVGVNAGAGLLQGSLGLTVTGAVANINASSNFATNINTGTSTGAVSIGNSLAGAIALQSGTSIGLTGVTNINVSANNNTNINTGTSTGTVTVGGNAVLFKNTNDSATSFQIQGSGSANALLNYDTTNQQLSLRNKTDTASIGAALTPITCSGTNWAGANPYTHTSGSTASLTCTSPSITAGTSYEITYTTAGTAAGQTFTPSLGGATGVAISGNVTGETQVISATTTANFAIVPTSTQTGSVTITTIKPITNNTSALAVKNSSGNVTLEVRAVASNMAIGLGSLQSNTSGTGNTGLGFNSLVSNTTGNYNTATGSQALQANTSGIGNTANGYQALLSNNSGQYNSAVGLYALQSNTSGSNNAAFGNQALQLNVSGNYNTSIGDGSLKATTTGGYNTALGASSLTANTSGNYNVGLGYQSLVTNTTGISNAAVGGLSLYTNLSGNYNAAIGYQSQYGNSTGSFNSSLGYWAGYEGSLVHFQTLNNLQSSTMVGAYAQAFASNVVALGGQGTNAAKVGIGTGLPANQLSAESYRYSTGTLATTSGSNAIVGTSTTFTADMVGNVIYIGSNSNTVAPYTGTIASFTDATHITVSSNVGFTAAAAQYYINYAGLQVSTSGTVGIGTLAPGTNQLVVDNGASTNAIFVARDNGAAVLTVADGGNITATGTLTVNNTATVRGLTTNTATGTDDQITLSVTAGGAARFTGTITNSDLTANRTYTLPDADGTFLLAPTGSGNGLVQVPTSNTAGVAGANVISPTADFINGLTINGTTAATNKADALIVNQSGTGVNAATIRLQAAGALAGAEIKLENASGITSAGLLVNRNTAGGTTTAGVNINNGAGTMTTGLNIQNTGTMTNGIQLAGAGTLTSAINLNSNATNGIIFNGTITTDITTGTNRALNMITNGTGALTLDSGTTGQINLGTGANSKTIQIGNTGNAVTNTINIGNNATASSVNNVTIGSTVGASATTLQAGTGNLNLLTNSASASVIVKSQTNSQYAFQVQNGAGNRLMQVDTAASAIYLSNLTSQNVSGGSGLYVDTSATSTSLNQNGSLLTVTATPASASTGSYAALGTWAGTTSANMTSAILYGVNGQAANEGTGTVGYVYGGQFRAFNQTSGTITNAMGINAQVRNASTGTITNAMGISVANPANSGTITNNYGIFVENFTTGTNKYPLYLQGATNPILTVNSNGDTTIRSQTNSGTALRVQNTTGQNLLTVDTTTTRGVEIGTQTNPASLLMNTSSASAAGILFNATYTDGDSYAKNRNGGTSAQLTNDALGFHIRVQGSSASVGDNINTTNMSALDISRNAAGVTHVAVDGASEPGNLMSNGSFEFNCDGWNVGACTVDATAANAKSGANSWTFTQSAASQGRDTDANQFYTVTPGEEYQIEAWIKRGASTTGTAGYLVTFYDKNGAWLSSMNNYSNAGTTSYARINDRFTIPANAYYIEPSISVRNTNTGAGQWWVDDIRVAKITSWAPQVLKNSVDSTTAFQIQNAAGAARLTVNTTNDTLKVNSATSIWGTTNSTEDFSVLDSAGSKYMLNVDNATGAGYVINAGTRTNSNELENPSFEAVGPASVASTASGWGLDPSNGKNIANDATNARTGKRVLSITGNASARAVDSSKLTPVTPGETVYFEGYIKHAIGATGTCGIFVTLYDKDGLNPQYINSSTWNDPGTSYALRNASFTVPANMTSMSIHLKIDAGDTGTWYFDDIYLKKATEQAPMLFKNSSNSTTAFQIQNAGGTGILNVNTTNATVGINYSNTASTDAALSVVNTTAANDTLFLKQATSQTGMALRLQNSGGQDVFRIWSGGAVEIRNQGTNMDSAFQVEDKDQNTLVNVNTNTGFVTINTIKDASGNLLQDGSFEGGSTFTWFANEVTTGNGIYNDSANARTGNKYLKGAGSAGTYDVANQSWFAVTPGDTYYAEGYVKADAGSNGDAGYYLQFMDKDKAVGGATYVNNFTGTPTTSYTIRTMSGTVPSTCGVSGTLPCVYARIVATKRNTATTGTFYWDDVFITSGTQKAPYVFKNSVDSANAFQVQNAAGNALMKVDTTSRIVTVGSQAETSTVNLGAVGAVAFASTVNVGTSTGAVQTVNIGSTNGTSTTTLNSGGTGTVTLNTPTLQFAQGANRTINIAAQGTAATPGNNLTVQAATGNTSGIGGTLTLQGGTGGNAAGGGGTFLKGGNAGGGNTNGGNVTVTGGNAAGTGVLGLVNLAPTAFTSAAVQTFASSGSFPITAGNVDTYSTLPVNVTTTGVTVTVPDPNASMQSVIGRVIYVAARSTASDFTLTLNSTRTPINIAMKANSTATLIWNGTDWTAAGASSSTTLQAAYDNTLTSAGGAEILLNNTASSNGMTIRNNLTNPIVGGGLLEVQSSIGTNLFSVNNNAVEYATNGGAETQGASSTTFPASTWAAGPVAGATVTREAVTTSFIATGQASTKTVTTATANQGIKNTLSAALAASTSYTVSFAGKLSAGTFTTVDVQYLLDGTTVASPAQQCSSSLSGTTLVTTTWTKITCTFTTPAAGITASNAILIRQTDATARTFYIDNLSVALNTAAYVPSNVQIGGGVLGGPVTLFTLDRSSTPPVVNGNTTYLGSMYYDTTSGRIQCYEADGWGACGSAPDNIVNLNPEYSGAVLNGTGVGTMTTDLCANGGGLTVNVGLCASGEARNLYKWTSPQATPQTYSIYVSYQLPSTFKAFTDDNTVQLTGRVDSTTNASVKYQMYRSEGGAISACGTETTVTSSANVWQTVGINGNEATGCGFTSSSGGAFVIFKINVTANSGANAYVSTLGFTTTGK